jgi:penicillin-binding protein 2
LGLIGLDLGKPRWFKPCLGQFKYGNRLWRCWISTGHGSLDLIHAIEQSCDIYFYQLGLSIGLNHLLEKMGEIFRVIRSDLKLPEERHSFIPTLDWYKDRYGRFGYGPGVVLNLSIGQGEILMTPLEIAYMTALVARDSLPPPWVIQEIDGEIVSPPPPRTLGFDGKFLKVIRRAMREVVEGKNGTGKAARIDGVVVAGKTGTAQNVHGKDHSLFTCFAPFENPRVVITVIVENAGHGSEVAAPIAGKILEFIFGGGV